MSTGVVGWFNDDRGFGFIRPDERGQVRQSGLPTLVAGRRVSFDVGEDRRSGKDSATNIRVAG